MINLKTLLGSRLLACCLGLVIPMAVQADDTEIYFARANAENAQNTPKANVLIMLDTSGSMRNCRTGSGSNWCSDVDNRRITLLHDAMKQIIADAPSTVEIGFGRFRGSSGGQILLPVMPVNDVTRPYFLNALNRLNGGQNDPYPSDRAQPSGSTPTSLAFDDMADYMLGRRNRTGISYSDSYIDVDSNSNDNKACISNAPDVEICREETQWSPPVEVDYCDPAVAGCTVTDTWEEVSYCDTDSAFCRLSDWSDWSRRSCSPRGALCERERYWGFWFYRTRNYEERNLIYSLSEQATVQVCEIEEGGCDDERAIVSGNNFVSPVNTANQCESNHIILFTDGAPSGDDPEDVGLVSCGRNSYDCQVSIASYLNSSSNSVSTPIKTHNIGLYMGETTLANMQSVSAAGGGETYDSDSAETLLEAFQSTLDLIDEDARSISAPGVAVNAMNRFQHLDQLYYSVFQPFESSYWNGNLKRYQVVDGEIHGQNGYAVDPATGYFRVGSQSVWSTMVDGPDVTKGGAREQVGTRSLFYTTSAGGDLQQMNWSSTSAPSNTQLGLSASATAADRTALLTELESMWGDPLHSVPVMVNYGEDAENNYVFVSTNGGMLHAIDTEDGSEAFAFMPHEILQKANQYTTSRPGLRGDNTRQTYGLDGSWVAWRQGGTNALAAPEAVYLYGGMRRGGRNYYALDVTDPAEPSMLWQVNNDSTGMAGLGQTWSTPTLTSVPDGDGNNVPILVVGGGYSPSDHDGNSALSASDQMGNMVYFLNASTGEVLWSAGGRNDATQSVTDMKWAVPSGIAVVDIDFDGVADHMYFGDLAGQVFRITVKDDGQHVVDRIANLGGTGSARRRFYEAPAVGLVRANTGNELYVVIGSGYRAHPLDETTTDGVFVIRDRTALNGSGAQTLATTANMTNVTAGGQPLSTARGWYYTFSETGEKALASPVIFNGRILFTTYAPTVDQESENPCAVRYGRAYLHTVNLITALPAALSDDLPTPASRSQALQQSTPAPTPTLLVDDEGKVITIVGTEVVGEGALGDPRLRKRRWMQLPPDEANSIRQSSVVEEEDGDEGDQGEDE
ncbi:PilC/PilY family type IV pilus protein [Halopseudomonas sp.]|uniref:PilC/PilY family type IV pilus protein n=1 Tax=Halopseudomonas sp. TaxID=2901191 RepID=UPI00311F0D82